MTPITSTNNPKLKELRKLARSRERARTGLFVAEGEDLVLAAQAAGRKPVYGFSASGLRLAGLQPLDQALLLGASALGSGTRAIGVYEQRFGGARGPLCVYLHGVKDPGNVGTVLRSALAFGAGSVALGPGCADPHSPKAVRASMGAIFAVELARVANVGELPGERVALIAHAGKPLAEVMRLLGRNGAEARGIAASAKPPAVTLLIGSEREGLPQELVADCEHLAHIPIVGESLNAAMAATVALYETTRPSSRVRES